MPPSPAAPLVESPSNIPHVDRLSIVMSSLYWFAVFLLNLHRLSFSFVDWFNCPKLINSSASLSLPVSHARSGWCGFRRDGEKISDLFPIKILSHLILCRLASHVTRKDERRSGVSQFFIPIFWLSSFIQKQFVPLIHFLIIPATFGCFGKKHPLSCVCVCVSVNSNLLHNRTSAQLAPFCFSCQLLRTAALAPCVYDVCLLLSLPFFDFHLLFVSCPLSPWTNTRLKVWSTIYFRHLLLFHINSFSLLVLPSFECTCSTPPSLLTALLPS